MKNKDFEKLIKNIKPVLPSNSLKGRIMLEQNRVPLIVDRPINRLLVSLKRYAFAISVFVITLIASITLLGFYGESYYEVYLDINPSVEVSVNRFGVVNGVKYINQDAENCLKGLDLKGKKPEEALTEIANELSRNGYFEGSKLFISGFSKAHNAIEETIEALYYRLSDLSEEQGYDVAVMTGEFSEEERAEAKRYNLSPLKYSLINQLIALDDGYTLEELAVFDMGELNSISNMLNSILSEETIMTAIENSISPMRYYLITSLEKMGCALDKFEQLTTKQLKQLYQNERDKILNITNERLQKEAEYYGVSVEKYRLIDSIIKRDPSYTIESLLDKSVFELTALDYALEKYNDIKDIFE